MKSGNSKRRRDQSTAQEETIITGSGDDDDDVEVVEKNNSSGTEESKPKKPRSTRGGGGKAKTKKANDEEPPRCTARGKCSDSTCFAHLKMPSIEVVLKKKRAELGFDVSLERDANIPFCGLRNLGATCYLNSLIQFLFMNESFRNAVLGWVDTNAVEDVIIRKLKVLFATMTLSPLRWVDPQDFVHALKVRTDVEQDVEEFRKLFFAHLEQGERLSKLIPSLFGGQMRNVITCMKCQRSSHSSATLSSFYELHLNPLDGSSVEECLGALFGEELLDEDNKYFCEWCQSKEIASKYHVVNQLPKVLFLSFRRYGYDMASQSRHKITNKVSFPLCLNITQHIKDDKEKTEHQQQQQQQTHCEQIQSPSQQQQHQHQDTNNYTISSSPDHSTAAHSTTTTTTTTAVNQNGLASSAQATTSASASTSTTITTTLDDSSTANHASEGGYRLVGVFSHAGSSALKGHFTVDLTDPESRWWRFNDEDVQLLDDHGADGRIVSSDAYLLVYADSAQPVAPPQLSRQLANSVQDAVENVQKKTHEFEIVKAEVDQIQAHVTRHGQVLKEILRCVQQQSRDQVRWIETDSLRSFFQDPFHSTVTNTSLKCSHGKLDPELIGRAKQLPLAAFNKMIEFGVTVDEDVGVECPDCQTELKAKSVRDGRQREAAAQLGAKVSNELQNKIATKDWMLLEKSVLQGLVPRRGKVPVLPDANHKLNASLLCEHGKRKPNIEMNAISLQLWDELSQYFVQSHGITKDEVECGQCVVDQARLKMQLSEQKDEKTHIKKEFSIILEMARRVENLVPTYCEEVIGETTWFLVDRMWIADLYSFVTSRALVSLPELTNERITCQHGAPLYDFVDEHSLSAFAFASVYCLITQEVWELIAERFPNALMVHYAVDGPGATITAPAKDCCGEQYAAAQQSVQTLLQSWENKPITVVQRVEQLPTTATNPTTTNNIDESDCIVVESKGWKAETANDITAYMITRPKRGLRSRTRDKRCTEMKVSASMLVSELKLAYSQTQQCFPSQIDLFSETSGGAPLLDSLGLGQCGVLPGSTVYAAIDTSLSHANNSQEEDLIAFQGTALLDS